MNPVWQGRKRINVAGGSTDYEGSHPRFQSKFLYCRTHTLPSPSCPGLGHVWNRDDADPSWHRDALRNQQSKNSATVGIPQCTKPYYIINRYSERNTSSDPIP